MQLGFFKDRIFLQNSQGGGGGGGGCHQDLTLLAVKTVCDNCTGCDEVEDCFVTEADTSIDIVCEGDLDEDWF